MTPSVTGGRKRLRPLLLAVLRDPHQLDRVEGELQRGFGGDFRVRGEQHPAAAARELETARERDQPVAVVLVDYELPEPARAELFALARSAHPT